MAYTAVSGSITSCEISAGTKTINDAAFSNCTGLTSVEIPDSVTNICIDAFSMCKELASVTIGNGVTHIWATAFYSCKNLTSIVIPDSVTNIDAYAFEWCNALTSITCKSDNPPAITDNAFDNTNNCPIYVPRTSVDLYQQAPGWSKYSNRIRPIA